MVLFESLYMGDLFWSVDGKGGWLNGWIISWWDGVNLGFCEWVDKILGIGWDLGGLMEWGLVCEVSWFMIGF